MTHKTRLAAAAALLVLGVAVYPALVIFAIVYVRLAERTERHFLDLVDKL